MSSIKAIRNRNGFTLIEVLVTLILLAVLAAAVFPVVTQQSDQGDPVRVANDLGSIRSAVEQFRLDVRPTWPSDIEDLAYLPVGGDVDLNNNAIGNASKWNGPYIDLGIASNPTRGTGTAFTSAFGAEVQNDLVCLSADVTIVDLTTAADCVKGNVVAVELTGVDATEAAKLELLIDGQASVNTTGKFRFDAAPTATEVGAAYVVGPYF
jgi:prepilin-type N-terminal cleavage/methylation domain-containing protein